MLTADLAIAWQRGSRIEPRLIDARDPFLQGRAADLIALFQQHVGKRRQEVEEALEAYAGAGTDYRVLRGWAKLLMDRCEFAVAAKIDPERLREVVFRHARAHHPVSHQASARAAVLAAAGEELQTTPEAIEAGLYADLPGSQELIAFEELSAVELLERYNLAQAQALLYRCQAMHLTVSPQDAAGYRRLFQAIKTYRLIHTITGDAEHGYQVTLDGPVSMFHRSQKYGIQMAVFLPALLLCTGWQMRAEIAVKDGLAQFSLNSEQRQFRSHHLASVPEGRPDLEKVLADWSRLTTEWRLSRSQEVLDLGGTAWAPDLVAQAPGSQPVYLELLGFWTPEQVAKRTAEIERGGISRFVLSASEELRCSREPMAHVPQQVVIYKTALDVRVLLSRLEIVR